jgi:hypothetical protein
MACRKNKFTFSITLIWFVSLIIKLCEVGAQPDGKIVLVTGPSGSKMPPSESKMPPSGSHMGPPPNINKGLQINPYNSLIEYSNSIINLDSIGFYNLSTYLTGYGRLADYVLDSPYSLTSSQEPENFVKNGNFSVDFFDESVGVQINYMSIKLNGSDLNILDDVSMSSLISEKIFPLNYFNGRLFSNQITNNTALKCSYMNPGPTYILSSLKNVGIDYLVSTVNKNFGLKQEEKGIRIIEMNEKNLKHTNLDDYLKKTGESNFTSTKDILFTKLFIGQDSISNDPYSFHLAAVCAEHMIYLYNISDTSYTSVSVAEWGIIPSSLLNASDINKVVFYNGQIFVSSLTSGFSILTKNNQWGVASYKEFVLKSNKIPLKLLDLTVVNSTIFMIAENFGLLTWDIKKAQLNQEYFKHPNLVRIDYTTFKSSIYLGVCVNNSVVDTTDYIPEIFIEFLYNFTNPSTPSVNRVYTSNKDINVEDVVSDNFLGLTYVMERTESKLTVLTRGIMNILTSYNFQINLKGLLNTNYYSDLMLISQNDQYFPTLVIKNGKDYVSLSRFAYPQTNLKCQVLKNGKYELKFNSPSDCSGLTLGSGSKYCYTNTSITFDVTPSMLIKIDDSSQGSNAGLWVILAILLVIVLSIVVVVVCCKVSCFKKGDKVAYHIQPQTGKEAEEIEVEVVQNKL